MKETELRENYRSRGQSSTEADEAVQAVKELESFVAAHGETLAAVSDSTWRAYLSGLIVRSTNTPARFFALLHYARAADLPEMYVYLVRTLGGEGIIPRIAQRTEALAGVSTRERVFAEVKVPPLGTHPSGFPSVVQRMIRSLQAQLPEAECRRVLAANHHRVPESWYEDLRRIYLEQGIDAMLEYRHRKLLSGLEEHARTGKVWHEQIITPPAVEMVRRNPEIQAGVRHGNTIHVTKIPHESRAYIESTDPLMRRYYQCHCPLARTSIIGEGPPVSPLFCYCSGGYEKLPFDVAFGEPVEVSVLQSALAGDETCRFAIQIPNNAVRL